MIGQVLKVARRQEGISQETLAVIIGISLWTLNRAENGHRTFDRRWLDRMPVKIRHTVIRALEAEHRQALDDLNESRTKIA